MSPPGAPDPTSSQNTTHKITRQLIHQPPKSSALMSSLFLSTTDPRRLLEMRRGFGLFFSDRAKICRKKADICECTAGARVPSVGPLVCTHTEQGGGECAAEAASQGGRARGLARDRGSAYLTPIKPRYRAHRGTQMCNDADCSGSRGGAANSWPSIERTIFFLCKCVLHVHAPLKAKGLFGHQTNCFRAGQLCD